MAKIITEKIFRYDIPDGKKKERVDTFLANSVENATRTRIQKLIEAGLVTANGKIIKSNYKVNPGDEIVLTLPIAPRPEVAEPEDIPIDVVYEDEFLLIINKPPGLVVHPSIGHYTGTLVNALLFHNQKLSDINDPATRPGIVHRIDKDTSGLLLIAKDNVTHHRLAAQFSAHSIEREYQAVAWGIFKEKKGEVQSYIARSKRDRKLFTMTENEGKFAHTFFEVIEEFDFATLLSLKLKTGRTHQIRVHLSGMGHPIFGDEFYGGRVIRYGDQLPGIRARVDNLLDLMPRQALHAKTLGFIHPHTKEFLRFDSELPADIKLLIEKLKKSVKYEV
ncbi:RluA family pseudouridine synthase [Ignavibacteriales bacterium]